VLPKRIPFNGIVRGPGGAPLAGARVVAHGPEIWRDEYGEVVTGADGRYAFPGAVPGAITIVVQADGLAPLSHTGKIDKSTPSRIDLHLTAGRAIRGTVTDAKRTPLADAVVALGVWSGHKHVRWEASTDQQGEFRWDHAPPGPIALTATRDGFNIEQAVVAADKSDVSIVMAPVLRVSGRVLDAETGKPIAGARFMPGSTWKGSPGVWRNMSQLLGDDGVYRIDFPRSREFGERSESFTQHVLYAEAPGFVPMLSRPFNPDEGAQTFDFKLKRGTGVSGKALGPDGAPLADADVVIDTPHEYATVHQGKVGPHSVDDLLFVKTAADGSFTIPPQIGQYAVAVLHERGWALTTSEALSRDAVVKASPWARVEGSLVIGGKPAVNQGVSVDDYPYRERVPGASEIDFSVYGDTDEKGNFVFPRVLPGTSGWGRGCRSTRPFPPARPACRSAPLPGRRFAFS
jgi:protocatechuate 3,4-dioxygenase beta subunit